MGSDATRPQPVECRSCKAPMYWVITANGKTMPVNATPDPVGGFVLALKADGKLYAEVFDLSHDSRRNRYTSHFATCPNAAQHRNPRDG